VFNFRASKHQLVAGVKYHADTWEFTAGLLMLSHGIFSHQTRIRFLHILTSNARSYGEDKTAKPQSRVFLLTPSRVTLIIANVPLPQR